MNTLDLLLGRNISFLYNNKYRIGRVAKVGYSKNGWFDLQHKALDKDIVKRFSLGKISEIKLED